MPIRFSITHKLVLGYLVIGFLLVSPAFLGLYSLRKIAAESGLHSLNNFETAASLRKMQAHLEAMEQCENRFLDSSSDEVLTLFQYHRGQFEDSFRRLQRLQNDIPPLREVSTEYGRYLDMVDEQIELVHSGQRQTALQRSVTLLSRLTNQIAIRLDQAAGVSRTRIEDRLQRIAEQSNDTSWQIILAAAGSILIGLGLVLIGSLRVASSLTKLKMATQSVGEGNFDLEMEIKSRDEIGELGENLTIMARKIKHFQELCLDASPLTRLPGNIAIERALMDKIRKGEKFALCYIDLDNFKAFNDAYGYAKGSDVIKAAGEIVHEAKRLHGSEDDFVGHIGGDDFVLITSPENVPNVCEGIIGEFDRAIPDFYTPSDRDRGFLEGTDRYGVKRKFPIMTISIAVVSDAKREITSPTEIAQIAAEIKEFAKDLPGSNYLIDRRIGPRRSI